MSDDKTTTDVEPTKTDVSQVTTQTPKTFEESEVKKIIEERDKAKAKLRKIDEDAKKAEEAAAIDRGEHEKVIASQREELERLRKLEESYQAEQSAVRNAALAKLSDEDKEIANELSTSKLLAFVERQVKQPKVPPASSKGSPVDGPEGSVDPLPNESHMAYEARMKKIGKAR
jgi:hypothetical protein